MKKFIEKMFESKALSFVLAALGMAFAGPVALASVGIEDVGKHGEGTDPNSGKPLEGATPDSPNKGIEQKEHAATGSAIEQAELNESHIDDYVSKYRAYRFPLHTDVLRKAKQIKVDVKDPTNWEVGEAVMELTTIGKIENSSKDEEITLTASQIAKNDWKMLRAKTTVMVGAALGHVGGVADNTPLVLYVHSKDNNGIVVSAVNGPLNNGTMYVPEIPAGTTMLPMAPAMSESEIEIAPNNAFPVETKCYLQKKVCAITYTELFERIKKKAKWNVQDLKDWNLEMFRRECTRSMLIGAPGVKTTYNERTGTEYCYFENGILRQLRLGYELEDGQIDFEDMIGMQSMMCGKYDTPNELTAYCGTKFIQRLLNIDFSKHKEYTVRNFTDEATKIKITSFESNFGKFNFVHEYGLDDLGYSECAIIFSIEEAKHFYYQKGKTININHEKGEGGEVREAKSQYYVKDDCVKLDGFNSMIVGPANLVGGYKLSALDTVIKSVNELTQAGSNGDIVYLVADWTGTGAGESSAKKYAIGLYKSNGTKWEAYNGKGIYVA